MEPLDSLIATKEVLEETISRIDVCLLLFGIIVVIGVAGESIFGAIAWRNNRKLHGVERSIDTVRQLDIVRVNKEAEEARKEAALANARAEEARKEAALAHERALRLEIKSSNREGGW